MHSYKMFPSVQFSLSTDQHYFFMEHLTFYIILELLAQFKPMYHTLRLHHFANEIFNYLYFFKKTAPSLIFNILSSNNSRDLLF